MRPVRPHVPICLRILTFLCLALSVYGRDSVRLSHSRFAFGPYLIPRAWTPVVSRVSNNQSRPANVGVVVSIHLGGRAGERVQYVRRVTLPPNSFREVSSFIMLDIPPEPLLPLLDRELMIDRFSDGTEKTFVKYKAQGLALSARVVDADTGQELQNSGIVAIPCHPNSQVISLANGLAGEITTSETYELDGLPYVLGEHDNDADATYGLEWPDAAAFSRMNVPGFDTYGRPVTPMRTSLDDLPRKWAAYEGIDTLVLGSLVSRRGVHGLTPQQRHSLLRWVRSGGRLVVVPAHDPEGYAHPFWRQLLPVRIVGRRSAVRALDWLEQAYDGEFTSDPDLPPHLVEALPGEGHVVVEADGRILAARRDVGGGEVWFVAMTGGAMADWSGGPRFWADVLRPRSDPVPGLKDTFSDSAPELLASIAGAAAPPRSHMMALMATYLGLALGALLACRMARRPEFGWPFLVALSAVGALCALHMGRTARARVGFVKGELGVTVLGSGESQGSATSFVGLFSPTERGSALRWDSPDTLATAHPESPSGDNTGSAFVRTLTVEQGDRFVFPEFRLSPGELKVARAMTLVSYGDGVALDVGFGPNGVIGAVENRTGEDLVDCIVRLNRRTLQIGSLRAGERRDLSTCSLSWWLAASDFGLRSGSQSDIRRRALADLLSISPTKSLGRTDRTFSWPTAFYGWSSTPKALLVLEGDSPPAELALQLLVVPVNQVRGEGRVMLPEGVCGLDLLDSGVRPLFGELRRRPSVDIVLPRATRIVGMKRKNKRPVSSLRMRLEKTPPVARKDPAGWNSGTVPADGRVRFVLPPGLEAMEIDRIVQTADIDVSNMTGVIGVAKRGSEHGVALSGLELSHGRVERPLAELAQVLGPNGEVPDITVDFSRPQDVKPGVLGRWTVRELDMKIWGTMPEK